MDFLLVTPSLSRGLAFNSLLEEKANAEILRLRWRSAQNDMLHYLNLTLHLLRVSVWGKPHAERPTYARSSIDSSLRRRSQTTYATKIAKLTTETHKRPTSSLLMSAPSQAMSTVRGSVPAAVAAMKRT